MTDPAETAEGEFWGGIDADRRLQRYQSFVNAVGDGIYQLDADGRFVAVNDAVVELTGYSRGDILGEHISLVLDERNTTRIEDLVCDLVGTEQDDRVETIECPVWTVNEEPVDCDHRLTPFLGSAEGDDRGVVGVVRLPESPSPKGTEATVKPPDHTLANLLDETDTIGVFVLNSDFEVAWVDETIERYFGVDREAIIGRDKRQLIDETIAERLADGETFKNTVFAAYDDNTHFEQFTCHVMAGDDREERWLEHLSKPIDSGPYAGGRIELYYDVSEQRRRTNQLRQLNMAVREWLEGESKESIAKQTSSHLQDILNMEINGVYLSDSTETALRPAAWTEPAKTLFDEVPTFREGEGIVWRVFESKQPEIYDDVRNVPEVYNPETPVRSEIVLPIGNHGVLIVGSEQRDAFDNGDLMLTEIVASTLEVTFDKITKQQRLEDRTAELKTELGEIFGRITDGFYALDEQWRFTHVNERAEELLGRSREELLGTVFWDVYPETSESDLYDRYHEAMATGKPMAFERYSDSLGIWVQVNVYPSETGLSVYIRDISDSKERERELEQYRAFTEAASDVIVTIDEDSSIQTVNPAVESVFGYDPDELVGESLTVLMPDELAKRHREALSQYLDTGDRTLDWDYVELPGIHADGSEIPLAVSFSEVEYEHERYFTGIIRDISERKQMNRKLQTERDLVEGIVETSPVGIVVVNDVGEITFANERAEEIYGRSREEIDDVSHDDPQWDLVDENGETLASGEAPFDRVIAREEPIYDQVVGLRRLSGERVWLSVNGAPQWTDGNLERAVFVFEDITERRELEAELDEILGRITDAFYALDEEFRFTHVNEQAEELLQASEEELLGETLWELYPGSAEITDVWDAFHTAMKTQEAQSYELYFDPLQFWVEATVYPSETGVSVYFRDVTERKEREAERAEMIRDLQENEERLQLALEAGEMGTWELDLQTKDSPVRSPHHDRIFGYEEPLDEWDFETFLDHVHPDDREMVKQGFERAFETGMWEFECRITRADGEQRVISAQGEFFFDSEEEPVRAVGVVQDVTERKEREQRLEELVSKLEESNERLEQFAYAASHDLQEPLRMVSSYLQLLERRYAEQLDEDADEYLEFAVDGADRMRGMIDGLLEYSRIETRGKPLEPVDLDTVLDDVLEDLQLRIEESTAEITVADLPRVSGDRSQLRQVFQNLLENALEYSGDDPPRVEVTAERTGSQWIVSVSDEGIGIHPDHQDRVFEVFERLHSHEEHGGTGIGLALCERIIERHDGDIWIDSVPGEGLTISFTLSGASEQGE